MGCFGSKRKRGPVLEEQKWDYINLSDFRTSSCLTFLSYFWLWVLVFVSIAVYAADTFTAYNFLRFNKFTSPDVKPPIISFDVAKWIFVGCIIFSWVLLFWEWIRAVRVMRTGSVTESYLDPLAAVLQSIRLGKGRGWRRFLVFARLTKSKKGMDYVALFVYFQFKGAIRIVLAEGPRQVINAMTLYGVLTTELIGSHKPGDDDRSGIEQFFANIRVLANTNRRAAVTYSTMTFTLFIWVIIVLSLIIALLLYLMFLWHYMRGSNKTLSAYCRSKVEQRLERTVSKQVKKALEKEEAKWKKEELKAMKKQKEEDGFKTQRKPTLPMFVNDDDASSIVSVPKTDTMPTNSTTPYSGPTRTNTMTTMGTSTTLSGAREPRLPTINPVAAQRPTVPQRSFTQSTNASGYSYTSNAPLLGQAADMGLGTPGREQSPMPPMPPMGYNQYGRPQPPSLGPSEDFPQRSYTPPVAMPRMDFVDGRNSPQPFMRGTPAPMENGYPRPPMRPDTAFNPNGRQSPAPMGMGPARGFPTQRAPSYMSESSRYTPSPGPMQNRNFSPYENERGYPLPHQHQRQPSRPNQSYEMSSVETQVPPQLQPGFGSQPPSQAQNRDSDAFELDAVIDSYTTRPPVQQYPSRAGTAPPTFDYQPEPAEIYTASPPRPVNANIPNRVLQSAMQRREGSSPQPPPPARSATTPAESMSRYNGSDVGMDGGSQAGYGLRRADTDYTYGQRHQ